MSNLTVQLVQPAPATTDSGIRFTRSIPVNVDYDTSLVAILNATQCRIGDPVLLTNPFGRVQNGTVVVQMALANVKQPFATTKELADFLLPQAARACGCARLATAQEMACANLRALNPRSGIWSLPGWVVALGDHTTDGTALVIDAAPRRASTTRFEGPWLGDILMPAPPTWHALYNKPFSCQSMWWFALVG